MILSVSELYPISSSLPPAPTGFLKINSKVFYLDIKLEDGGKSIVGWQPDCQG